MSAEDPLGLDPEAMRAMGHRMVDFLVDELAAGGPVLRRATPAEMAGRLDAAPPEDGRPLEELLGSSAATYSHSGPASSTRASSPSSPRRRPGRARSATSWPAR